MQYFGLLTREDGKYMLPRNVGKKLPYSLHNNLIYFVAETWNHAWYPINFPRSPSHILGNYLILGRRFLSLLTASSVLCYYTSYRNCLHRPIIFKTVTANTLPQRLKQTKIFRRYISLTYYSLCRCSTYEIMCHVSRMQDYFLQIFHKILLLESPNIWAWYTTIRVYWPYPTSSWMWQRVVSYIYTDVSGKPATSMLRAYAWTGT
jgi:hypothetical protein